MTNILLAKGKNRGRFSLLFDAVTIRISYYNHTQTARIFFEGTMTSTSSRQNLKDHIALTVLEDVDGFLVAETLEADRVDG